MGTSSRPLGQQQIKGTEERQAAQTGAREIGEIDAAEMLLPAQEGQAQEHGAGQEGREIEQEVRQQAQLLLRIGNQEDRIERHLLGETVGERQQRAEGQQTEAG